ncbi:hypothetical protein M406DRAFT_347016 [Cryphonectria parasitica EP155]|uniref:NB-ARC domain-containing protein n=1 Tax=Cryphonectria parasitica (strain ATCC 38755 / EP155) TaxID=660469 RepID=A0A9P4XYK3_CRYP1|nr:uncharacterized protein M406DRAFT_347016 [Cryphonectria parasitica EP155]KAF3763152.1 hypothetical protein M406DRAFT_347016 [Cryphonectria parasitica EP155]
MKLKPKQELQADWVAVLVFFHQNFQRLALVGLGGIGKTQIALKFAYWVRQAKPEYSIFWVPALSDATFEQACDAIARKLPAQVMDKNDDLKRVVQRYLSSGISGPWLLVVDNADDEDIFFGPSNSPGGLWDYLPDSEGGLTLFTTRSRKLAVETEADIIDIHEMDSDEAMGLLGKWLSQNQLVDAAAVRKLLKELTYLPLAITQAAAYLNSTQVSIADYLQLLRSTEKDIIKLLSREFRDGNRYPGSQNAVATTWLVSFEQIRKSNRTAADLLAFISCIEPKAIPRSLLPNPESEETFYAIGTLRGYAFLVSREDSVFDMHNLVHLATRAWVAKQGFTAQVKETAMRHLERIFPSDDFANRNLWRDYLPHALKLFEESKDLDIKEAADLYEQVGRCLRVDGRVKEAVACLRKCCLWKESNFSDETHPSRLASQHVLAGAYQENGQVKEAVELLEHVVKIRETTLDETHPSRLASQHELARAYQANGQVKEAVEHVVKEAVEHVVKIQETTLDETHPSRLASQHELARAYQANGQVKEAVELLEHVVKIQETTLDETHPSQLTSQHELARAYQANGQVKEAVEHVVKIQETTLDETHPSRLASQHELARAYQEIE